MEKQLSKDQEQGDPDKKPGELDARVDEFGRVVWGVSAEELRGRADDSPDTETASPDSE
jgi:hypothetical protein